MKIKSLEYRPNRNKAKFDFAKWASRGSLVLALFIMYHQNADAQQNSAPKDIYQVSSTGTGTGSSSPRDYYRLPSTKPIEDPVVAQANLANVNSELIKQRQEEMERTIREKRAKQAERLAGDQLKRWNEETEFLINSIKWGEQPTDYYYNEKGELEKDKIKNPQ